MTQDSCEYAAVVRNTTILAQYANTSGNFDILINDILQKLNPHDNRFTTEKDGHKFYAQRYSDSGTYFKDSPDEPTQELYFVIVTFIDFPANQAYTLLDAIQKSFLLRHSRAWQKAPPYGLNNEFSGEIRRCIDDKISKIQSNLENTVDLMKKTLQLTLSENASLEDLLVQAESISNNSQDYSRAANQIRRKMACEKYRYAIIIAIIAIVMILIIVIAVTCSDDKSKK